MDGINKTLSFNVQVIFRGQSTARNDLDVLSSNEVFSTVNNVSASYLRISTTQDISGKKVFTVSPGFTSALTSTTAISGIALLPIAPAGFVNIEIQGAIKKIAYYN